MVNIPDIRAGAISGRVEKGLSESVGFHITSHSRCAARNIADSTDFSEFLI